MDIADRADALVELDQHEGRRRAMRAISGAGSTICEECGEMIEPARLRALPSARTCICCQQEIERDARRGRR